MEAGTHICTHRVEKILLDVTQFTSYPLNSHHYKMMLALLFFNSNKHRMTEMCLCVRVQACAHSRVCVCVCV